MKTRKLLAGIMAGALLSATVLTSVPVFTQTCYAEEQKAEKTFTDSLGREVKLPENITKIAPSGNIAQLMLYALAPEKMVGFSANPGKELQGYFSDEQKNLPIFGAFYGKKANLNKEALIKAAPEVIIDLGEVKGSKEKMTKDLDKLQEQLDIPVVFIEAKLVETGKAFETLGQLLGMEKEAKPLVEYCNNTIKDVEEKASQIKNKVTVYYGEEKDGLNANPKGSFHCEVIDLVGGENVADIKDAGKGENKISPEQLIMWNPDVIILGKGSIYSTIGTDEKFKDIKAVKDHRYYEIPSIPYNWIDRPPAVNRILGIKWLGNILYPEVYNYNIKEDAKTFYKLFYHHDLTDDELNKIMENGTLEK